MKLKKKLGMTSQILKHTKIYKVENDVIFNGPPYNKNESC